MDFLFYIIFGVVIVGIAIGTSVNRGRKWQEAAANLGLRYEKGGIFGSSSLSGDYDGVAVSIRTVSRGGKNNRKTYTVYEADLPAVLPPGLQLSAEHFLSSVGKFFGAQDVQVGLPILDDTFIIKAARPETAREFLQRPGVEDTLLELYDACPALKLEDGSFVVENHGFDSAFELESTLDLLTDAAHQLSGTTRRPDPAHNSQGPPPSEGPEPADQQSFGRPGETTESVEPAEPSAGNSPDQSNEDWW